MGTLSGRPRNAGRRYAATRFRVGRPDFPAHRPPFSSTRLPFTKPVPRRQPQVVDGWPSAQLSTPAAHRQSWRLPPAINFCEVTLPRRTATLAPRLRDRLAHAVRPGWARSLMVRRGAALALVIAAAVSALAGHESRQQTIVYVAAHDLTPGQSLTSADLRQQGAPDELIPAGALRLSADAQSRTVTAPVRAGEIITESRLLTSRLPAQLTGTPDARLVPVRLADESTAALLRAGDVVDVLTTESRVLARDAIVALVPAAPTASGRASAPILLAMPGSAAHLVASSTLDVGLAVVLH